MRASLLAVLCAAALSAQSFEWRDRKGAIQTSEAWNGRVTAVVFVSVHCPIAVAYGPRLKDLVRRYEARGVRFLFLIPNYNESDAEIAQYERRAQLSYPLHRDVDARAAIAFGVEATPEVRLLDATGKVRYRGAIDDSKNEARVKVRGLELAIEDLLAGRPVGRPEIKAFGCTIKRRS